MSRQCELLGLSRRSYYYHPATTDTYTLELLRLIDEEYTRHPFLGTRRMRAYLASLGHEVNRKRLQRLYRIAGIEAVYCKPNLSKAHAEHVKYPYLLRDFAITHPNQVFCADITYIRLQCGFMYLFAIMDWFSRYVLGWSLSPSLDADFCVELLQAILLENTCEIFNTDQGVQFTSTDFTRVLTDNNIKISMDGKGRALDNVFIERLWRSVKYECVYLAEFSCVAALKKSLHDYFDYYNHHRHHESLDYRTPASVHFNTGIKSS